MTSVADNQVSTSALDSYQRDGYVIFRNVIDAELIKEVNDHVDWLQARHPDVRPEQLGHVFLRDDPFWVRLVSDDRAARHRRSSSSDPTSRCSRRTTSPSRRTPVSRCSGTRTPRSGRSTRWSVVTLWLAVDHSTPENGCVRVVPGSHRGAGRRDARQRRASRACSGKEIAVEVDESAAVDIVLAPGDVEVHHPNIVHGSNANTSPHRRCGLTIRYIPTSTRITDPEIAVPERVPPAGAARA